MSSHLGPTFVSATNAVQKTGDTMSGVLTIGTTLNAASLLVNDDGFTAVGQFTGYQTSATAGFGSILLRHANGTQAAPLRAQSGNVLGRIGANEAIAATSAAAATFPTAARSRIDFVAAEDQLSTATGSQISLWTTPLLSVTPAERMRVGSQGQVWIDTFPAWTDYSANLHIRGDATNRTSPAGGRGWLDIHGYRKGSSLSTSQFDSGVYSVMSDDPLVKRATVTGTANSGGLVQLTLGASHGMLTGDRVTVSGVLGTTEANGSWTIAATATSSIDLTGTTFVNAWSAGGTQVATTAGIIYTYQGTVIPVVDRGLTGPQANFDDVSCFLAFNAAATAIAGTDCFYVGHAESVFPRASATVEEWGNSFNSDCLVRYAAFRYGGRVVNAAGGGAVLRFDTATVDSGNFGILMGNSHIVGAVNNAGAANLSLFKANTSDQLELMIDTKITDAKNIVLAASGTGTKIGTATTQLLGLWNATPVAQYATTGTLTGFTAATTTPVLDGSTFTGNTGTKAYTIGDIVRALKLAGIMAAS